MNQVASILLRNNKVSEFIDLMFSKAPMEQKVHLMDKIEASVMKHSYVNKLRDEIEKGRI